MTDALEFTDLSAEQIETLESIHEAKDAKETLAEFLGNPTDDVLNEAQRDVLLDMHMYNLAFCKDLAFDSRKTSVFFAIVNRVLEVDLVTNAQPVSASFAAFKRLLLQHAVERSPHSVGVFSEKDVAAMVQYMMNGYYRHFNLYKYMFTSRLQVDFVQQQPGQVEEIRRSRPLNESMQVE